MNKPPTAQTTIKQTLYNVIFGTNSKAGRNFDIALLLCILSSVTLVMLESIAPIDEQYGRSLYWAEWVFTGLFTIEYITRIYCTPRPRQYLFSFFGIIDLLSILPAFVAFLYPDAGYLVIIRLVRVLRVFRVFKLFQYITETTILLRSLAQSRRKIFVFFSAVLIIAIVLGSLMYIVEGEQNGFHSIPEGIYWAIVTLTTVGYGDVVPHTVLGKALAAFAMLTGYAIIAIPTGIISAELIQEMHKHRQLSVCDNCQKSGHETDAVFCKHCGHSL